jgi:hypothetical protein
VWRASDRGDDEPIRLAVELRERGTSGGNSGELRGLLTGGWHLDHDRPGETSKRSNRVPPTF